MNAKHSIFAELKRRNVLRAAALYAGAVWALAQPEPWSRKARQDPAFQDFAQRIGMVAYWKKFGWPDLCKPAPEKGPDGFVCQ